MKPAAAILLLVPLLTGCGVLTDIRVNYDFAQKQLSVSVPLQKPTSSK